jgi:Peptidase_C39 like family
MKTTLRHWRTAVAATGKRGLVLAAAALAVAGAAGGSIAAALAEPGSTSTSLGSPSVTADQSFWRLSPMVATASTDTPAATTAAGDEQPAAAPAQAAVDHAFELQPNYYYCGPAATRVALSAHGQVFSEDQLAAMLGTTTAGTPSAFDITRVLNQQLGDNRYRTVELAQRQVTAEQIAQLKSNVVRSVSHGDTVVANVIGEGTDASGHSRSYPVGHYLNIVGYVDQGEVAQIADSADPTAPNYQIAVGDLAQWIGSRGYAASNA